MSSLCQDALLVRMMFDYGLITGPAIIDWADAQILALDSPMPKLLELSTTPVSRTADLLSHLSALADDADYWEAFRVVLAFLYERIASRPESTERFASEV